MGRFIMVLGVIFMVTPIRAEKPPKLGKVKIEIEAFEDRTIYAKTRIVPLKNLRASEIEPFIRSRLSSYGAVQVNDAANTLIITDMEPKLSDLVKLVKGLDAKGIKEFVRLETRTLHPKYVLPSKLRSILTKSLSPDGSIYVDDDLNAIMITDVSSRIERIKEILAKLDAPPKQVLIEGRLVVIDSDYLRELGIHLPSLVKKAIERLNISIDENIHEENGEEKDKSTYYRASISPDLPALADLIDQSIQEGKANVSTFPSLVIQNNKEGEIYISEFESPYNVRLSIQPHIGGSDFMSLNINFCGGKTVGESGQVVSRKYYHEESRDRRDYYHNEEYIRADSPIGRGVNTVVMIKDGDTFVLGGIEYIQESIEEKGIPILRAIPLLGWLFKRETKVTTKKELVALITPHILEFGESPKIEKK